MKKIMIILMAALMAISMTACNKQVIDTAAFKFDRAIVSLPNGEVISGAVESWADYEDGDQLQVKIDGCIYLTHSSNVVLIKD